MATRTWTGTTSGDWSVSTNWAEGVVPSNGDDVYFGGSSSVSVTASLNQSAVTLGSLTVEASYAGQIGTATAYLQISATTVNVNRKLDPSQIPQSSRIKISGIHTTVNVFDGPSAGADSSLPAILLSSPGTIATVNVKGGRVGIGMASTSDTTAVTTLNVTKTDNTSTTPTVFVGQSATVSNVNQNTSGVTVVNNSNNTVAAAKVNGGEYLVQGNGAHTALTLYKGACRYNGTGTIGTGLVYAATLDFRGDQRAKTVTNLDVWSGASVYLDTGVIGSVTLTNGIDVQGVDQDDVTLRFGPGRKLTLGTAT